MKIPGFFLLPGNKVIEAFSVSLKRESRIWLWLFFLLIFLVIIAGFIYGQLFSLAQAQAAEVSTYGSHSVSGTVQYYYKWMPHTPPKYPSSQSHYFNLGTPGTVHFQIDWLRRGGSKEAITGFGLYKREYSGWQKIRTGDFSWPWKPASPTISNDSDLPPGEYKLQIYVGFIGFFDPATNYPVDYQLNVLTLPQSIYNSQTPLPIAVEEATLKEIKEYLKQVSVKFAEQALVWDSIKESVFKNWFGCHG